MQIQHALARHADSRITKNPAITYGNDEVRTAPSQCRQALIRVGRRQLRRGPQNLAYLVVTQILAAELRIDLREFAKRRRQLIARYQEPRCKCRIAMIGEQFYQAIQGIKAGDILVTQQQYVHGRAQPPRILSNLPATLARRDPIRQVKRQLRLADRLGFRQAFVRNPVVYADGVREHDIA